MPALLLVLLSDSPVPPPPEHPAEHPALHCTQREGPKVTADDQKEEMASELYRYAVAELGQPTSCLARSRYDAAMGENLPEFFFHFGDGSVLVSGAINAAFDHQALVFAHSVPNLAAARRALDDQSLCDWEHPDPELPAGLRGSHRQGEAGPLGARITLHRCSGDMEEIEVETFKKKGSVVGVGRISPN